VALNRAEGFPSLQRKLLRWQLILRDPKTLIAALNS